MNSTKWEVLFEPIIGINVGLEYVEVEEEEAYIIDLFLFRIVFIKSNN